MPPPAAQTTASTSPERPATCSVDEANPLASVVPVGGLSEPDPAVSVKFNTCPLTGVPEAVNTRAVSGMSSVIPCVPQIFMGNNEMLFEAVVLVRVVCTSLLG
jgi:hypothetical protein